MAVFLRFFFEFRQVISSGGAVTWDMCDILTNQEGLWTVTCWIKWYSSTQSPYMCHLFVNNSAFTVLQVDSNRNINSAIYLEIVTVNVSIDVSAFCSLIYHETTIETNYWIVYIQLDSMSMYEILWDQEVPPFFQRTPDERTAS